MGIQIAVTTPMRLAVLPVAPPVRVQSSGVRKSTSASTTAGCATVKKTATMGQTSGAAVSIFSLDSQTYSYNRARNYIVSNAPEFLALVT